MKSLSTDFRPNYMKIVIPRKRSIHYTNDLEKKEFEKKYGAEIFKLYDWIKDKLDDEILQSLR